MTITTAAQTSTRCPRCGRVLTSARSLAAGIGRTCKAKVAAAALASVEKPAQVEKAIQLVTDGGLLLLPGHKTRVFRSVSSDGTRTYLTAATGQCNCPAGLRNKPCYHGLGAGLLTRGLRTAA